MNNTTIPNSEYEKITNKSHNSVIKNQITNDTKYVFVGTNTQYHIEKEENKEDYSFASGYFYGGVETSVYEIIDELCDLKEEDSLVLKKELLCKKLIERDIWGWENVEQDMQKVLRNHKIAFLDTLEYETLCIKRNGAIDKHQAALDYDSFVETYNKNSNIIFIPIIPQAYFRLNKIEEHTGLKFHISTLVLYFEDYNLTGGLRSRTHYSRDNDDYFESVVEEYTAEIDDYLELVAEGYTDIDN